MEPEWSEFGQLFVPCLYTFGFVVIVALVMDWVNRPNLRPPRQHWGRVKVMLASPVWTLVCDALDVLANVCVVVLYIYRSHTMKFTSATSAVDAVCVVLLGLSYFRRWWIAPETTHLGFVVSLASFIDAVSLPFEWFALLEEYDSYLTMGFLRAWSVFIIVQRVEGSHPLANALTTVLRQTWLMCVSFVAFLCVFAGSVATLELLEGDTPQDWTFANAVYFSLVTMSTVGYGDMSPQSVVARLWVMALIVVGIVFFSVETGKLLDLVKQREQGTGIMTNLGKTNLLCVGVVRRPELASFLGEVFHSDSQALASNVYVCVMCEDSFNHEDQRWLRLHPVYSTRVTYLKGDVFDAMDLERAQLQAMHSVFIFGSKISDHSTILRAMSLKRFAPPHVRVCASLSHADNRQHLVAGRLAQDKHIVCGDELLLGLMAQNAIAPGASTLLANLLTSDAEETYPGEALLPWQHEYRTSLTQEVYEVPPPAQVVGMSFQEAVLSLWVLGLAKGTQAAVGKAKYKQAEVLPAGPDVCDGWQPEWNNHVGVLLIAIRRDGHTLCNFSGGDGALRIQDTDKLFLVWSEYPELPPDLTAPSVLAAVDETPYHLDDSLEEPGGATTEDLGAGATVAERVLNEARRDSRLGPSVTTSMLSPLVPPSPSESKAGPRPVHPKLTLHAQSKKELLSLSPPPGIADHVVLCNADGRTALLFLVPFRRQNPGRPVVIVGATPPYEWWQDVETVASPVYFVLGQATDARVLRRARVTSARRVVVLAVKDKNKGLAKQRSVLLVDRKGLFTTMMLENTFAPKNRNLLFGTSVAFNSETTVAVLPAPAPSASLCDGAAPLPEAVSTLASTAFKMTMRYAAGRVVSASSANSILAKLVFNDDIGALARTLTLGETLGVRYGTVPDRLVGKPYALIVAHAVLSMGAIPLGLLRDPTPFGAELPFVSTNPKPCAIVNSGDLVFLMCSAIRTGQ